MTDPSMYREWHILDTRMLWVREFASALLGQVEGVAWMPDIGWTGALRQNEREAALADPPLGLVRFPLQRGFYLPPVAGFESRRVLRRLLRRTEPGRAVLVCTLPHYAPVVESWPGPSIYYATDLFRAYEGWDGRRVAQWERSLCRTATLVCPNSERIADCFREDRCASEKIAVIPNATRMSNLLPEPQLAPADAPADMKSITRPIAGVIGNLGANTDWPLLRAVIQKTPWLSWVLVGPAAPVTDRAAIAARDAVMHSPRAHFLGAKPYGELRDYARAFDVAVLPYTRQEPGYSGSSTRFYEHLAACRPILSTSGVQELLSKSPSLSLADTADDMAALLERLRSTGFRDGLEELRWRESRKGTWDVRAQTMQAALEARLMEAVHA